MVGDPNGQTILTDETVVGSIDSDGSKTEYVIADISSDGAWLSMHATDAPTLKAWR